MNVVPYYQLSHQFERTIIPSCLIPSERAIAISNAYAISDSESRRVKNDKGKMAYLLLA